MRSETLNNRYSKLKWMLEAAERKQKEIQDVISAKEESLEIKKEASIVIGKAAEDTFTGLQTNITDIVNQALSVVFDKSYKMCFAVSHRGTSTKTTNVSIKLCKDGVELSKDLTSCCEGGVLAVCSIILRTAFLLLNKENRKVLLLDEVLGSLSRVKEADGTSALEKSYDILKKLSEKFGVQVILVSHTGVDE